MVLSWLQNQLGFGTKEGTDDTADHESGGRGTADEPAAKRVRTEELVQPQVPLDP